MTIKITNEKGLIAVPTEKAVVTEHALGVLRGACAKAEGTAPKRAKLARLVELLEGLPSISGAQDSDLLLGAQDFQKRPGHGIHPPGLNRCVLVPGPFMGDRDPYINEFNVDASAQGFCWDRAEELLTLARALRTELNTLGVTVLPRGLNSAMGALARSESWEISRGDDLSELVEGKTYAIYRTGCNGYINDKGLPRPLSAARLFSSAEAARRTAKAQGLDDAVIVEANIQVRAIDPILPCKADSPLHAAMSWVRAKELDASTPPSAARRAPGKRL